MLPNVRQELPEIYSVTSFNKLNDLESAHHLGPLPTLKFCAKQLNYLKLLGKNITVQELRAADLKLGGFGAVTLIDQFAIKRSSDIAANNPTYNEVRSLLKVCRQIMRIKVQGFKVNLPFSLLNIIDAQSGSFIPCNIQVSLRVKIADLTHANMSDVVDIYMKTSDILTANIELQIVQNLGRKLASFQQSIPVTTIGRYDVGLQHGDLNPNNILISSLSRSGEHANFTLIDNNAFRKDGRLISDVVYFIYFANAISSQHPKHQQKISHIINRFYLGYLQNLNKSISERMKTQIFDRTSPLFIAQEGYKYNFKNLDSCEKYLEPMQIEAFNKAYQICYPTPKKAPVVAPAKPQGQQVIANKHNLQKLWKAPANSLFINFELKTQQVPFEFFARFMPMDNRVREMLKKEGLKMAKDKSAMQSGVYSTTNVDRQLILLKIGLTAGVIPSGEASKLATLIKNQPR